MWSLVYFIFIVFFICQSFSVFNYVLLLEAYTGMHINNMVVHRGKQVITGMISILKTRSQQRLDKKTRLSWCKLSSYVI